MEAVVAGLSGGGFRQSLPQSLVEEQKLVGFLIDDIDHFLHVIDDIDKTTIFLSERCIAFPGQLDCTQQAGKGAQIVQFVFTVVMGQVGSLEA